MTHPLLLFYDSIDNGNLEQMIRLVETQKLDLNTNFQEPYVREKKNVDVCPIHLAAYRGHASMVNYLVHTSRVDITCTTSTLLRTPIHRATQGHHFECLRILLEAGGETDARDNCGNTPLQYAAVDGDIQIVVLLLEAGANPDSKDIENKTPLMKATFFGHLETINLLISAGASPNIKYKNGDTVLHIAARRGSIAMIEMFLKTEGKIDAQNHNGLTPLMEAVSYNKREVVSYLFKRNCDLYKRDFRIGNTALHIAVTKNYTDLVEILLTTGNWYTEFNVNNLGESPVHDAVIYNRLSLIRLFLTHNYNLDYPAKKLSGEIEKSPLQLALDRGHVELARILARVNCSWTSIDGVDKVWPLKNWCRKVIRKRLGFRVCDKVPQLILPLPVKNFLLLNDIY